MPPLWSSAPPLPPARVSEPAVCTAAAARVCFAPFDAAMDSRPATAAPPLAEFPHPAFFGESHSHHGAPAMPSSALEKRPPAAGEPHQHRSTLQTEPPSHG